MDENRIKIAIIEDSPDFCKSIELAINAENDLTVVGTAQDGEEGLKLLLENEIDVALLDVVLPVKDGLFILEELKKAPGKKPICIMLSGMNLEAITKKALQNGADYFIVKPFDMDLMVKRVREIYEFKNQSTPRPAHTPTQIHKKPQKGNVTEAMIVDLLHRIPIQPHLKGYNYLKTAILLSLNDRKLLQGGITKGLYPTVARECQTTPSRVERAIRHAIDASWSKGFGHNYFAAIGYQDTTGPKPTNSAFISAIVEYYNGDKK